MRSESADFIGARSASGCIKAGYRAAAHPVRQITRDPFATGRRSYSQRCGRLANASPVRDERIANLEQRDPAVFAGPGDADAVKVLHGFAVSGDKTTQRMSWNLYRPPSKGLRLN